MWLEFIVSECIIPFGIENVQLKCFLKDEVLLLYLVIVYVLFKYFVKNWNCYVES